MAKDTYTVMYSGDTADSDTYEASSREEAVKEFQEEYAGLLIGYDEDEVTVLAYVTGDEDSERVPFLMSEDSVRRL